MNFFSPGVTAARGEYWLEIGVFEGIDRPVNALQLCRWHWQCSHKATL